MPTSQRQVQDENVVTRRVKVNDATSTGASGVANGAGNGAGNGLRRPALSNVTNTSTVQVQTSSQTRGVKRRARAGEEEDQAEGEGNGAGDVANDNHKRVKTAHEAAAEVAEAAEAVADDEPSGVARDLDSEDSDDPLMVNEYVVEIFEYLRELEITTTPRNYLENNDNLKPRMRSILVDWLVEVHLRFRLTPETLFLAINTMDRFLSLQTVEVEKLQLLATGCLFIAAKYEEVWSPSVKNYAYVTDGGSTEEEILSAERFILKTLNFDLSYPNPMNFLRRISKADDYDIETRTMGKYLLEITIMDHKFLGVKPSLCAASAMYLSRKLLQRSEWDVTLKKYSGNYTLEEMRPVVNMIVDYVRAPVTHDEFFKKYASKKYMKSSILARQLTKKFDLQGITWI